MNPVLQVPRMPSVSHVKRRLEAVVLAQEGDENLVGARRGVRAPRRRDEAVGVKSVGNAGSVALQRHARAAMRTAASLDRMSPPLFPSVVEDDNSIWRSAMRRCRPSCQALPRACRTRQATLTWCMAKIIAVEPQARPSTAQTSATSAARAPSPPNSLGISMPSSFCSRIAANASAGKRASRSTSSAKRSAIAATVFGAGEKIARARTILPPWREDCVAEDG